MRPQLFVTILPHLVHLVKVGAGSGVYPSSSTSIDSSETALLLLRALVYHADHSKRRCRLAASFMVFGRQASAGNDPTRSCIVFNCTIDGVNRICARLETGPTTLLLLLDQESLLNGRLLVELCGCDSYPLLLLIILLHVLLADAILARCLSGSGAGL